MKKVVSNLKLILDERELSVLKVAKDINYRYESVRKLYNNDNEHFPKELISKLCHYLEVTPGELIVLKDNPDC